MAFDFVADNAAFYLDFGVDAVYGRSGVDPINTRVLIGEASEFDLVGITTNQPQPIYKIMMPVANVSSILRGDTITVGVNVYSVDGLISRTKLDIIASARLT